LKPVVRREARYRGLADRGPDKDKNEPRNDDDRDQKPQQPGRLRQRLSPPQHLTFTLTKFSVRTVDGSQRRSDHVGTRLRSVIDATALSAPVRATEQQRQKH